MNSLKLSLNIDKFVRRNTSLMIKHPDKKRKNQLYYNCERGVLSFL